MRHVLNLSILMLIATGAVAQQPQPPADPAFMQHAITALQEQRNQALDSQAATAARLKAVSDDLAKAQARIAELEKQAAAPEKK